MPDWEKLEYLWNQIFGNDIAFWLLRILGTIATLWLILWFIAQIVGIWKNTILPIFYNSEEKKRSFRRRLFAQNLEHEINIINRQERDWEDYRFTELEAEVEAEGLHTKSSFIPLIKKEYKGLRREKSLSKALKASKESIILLEGDPGAGKSVALRHVALDLIKRAKKARSNLSLLPIYINLRGLKRQKNQPIDRQLILDYIMSSINRSNMRDVDMFLENEFEKGLHAGTWIFLFDSFDEIPDILSAREVDHIVKKYSDAISDFLHGMNNCRGIVASRYFRGPGHVDWPHFNIVGLTFERQTQLVKQARIPTQKEKILIGQLATARSEVQSMATNPLFLSMIIEHSLSGREFPENIFTVFETYVNQRFEQDQERLRKRFGLEHTKVRRTAEIVAFCMTSDSNIGLSPYRENLKEAIQRLNLEEISNLDNYLDALEFIKIGRSEDAFSIGTTKSFSFSHRRFQEYFATNYVLGAIDRVSPSQLLTDARWRETAVVLCQTRPEEEIQNLVFEAGENLYQYALEIEVWLKTIEGDENISTRPLKWPFGLLYLLSLLQDGFSHRRHILPEYIQSNASFILLTAQQYGIFPDRKWALEVAGIAKQDALLNSLRLAIQDKSVLLNQVAYEQVSKLENIPEDVSLWIRKSLIEKSGTSQLRKQQFTTHAFLSRLTNKNEFLKLLRLLLNLPVIDLFLHILFVLMIYLLSKSQPSSLFNFDDWASIISSGIFGLMPPLMSYGFTYFFSDKGDEYPFGIEPYAISFLFRIVMSMLVFNLANESLTIIASACFGYLLLVPISAIILIKDGVNWKRDVEILGTPVQVIVYGINQRNKKRASTRLIVSFLVMITAAIGCGLLFSNMQAIISYENPSWLIPLYCLAVPGLLIGLIDMYKKKKNENIKLKNDQLKLQVWKKEPELKRSGKEFLELFIQLETAKYMLNLLEIVARNDLLEKNESSELAIKSAIQFLETKGITKELVQVVDEMCILLERTQSAKEIKII